MRTHVQTIILLTVLAVPLSQADAKSPETTIQQALQMAPASSSGFLVVNGHQKIEKKARELDKKLTSFNLDAYDHEMLRQQILNQTWLSKFNPEDHSVTIIFLEPNEKKPPVAVWLIPVSDYEKFLKTLPVKKQDGKFAHVEYKDSGLETLLVASKGSFAVVAKMKNQASMQKVLSDKTSLADSLNVKPEWIAQWDVVGVATRAGWVKHFSQWIAQMPEKGPKKSTIKTSPKVGAVQHLLKENLAEIAIAGKIDKDHHLRFASRIFFTKEGRLAKAAKNVMEPQADLLARLPNHPYLFAMATDMPEKLEQAFTKLGGNLTGILFRGVGTVYGYAGIASASGELQELFAGMGDLQKQATSMAFLVHPTPEKRGGQRGVFCGELKVKNSGSF